MCCPLCIIIPRCCRRAQHTCRRSGCSDRRSAVLRRPLSGLAPPSPPPLQLREEPAGGRQPEPEAEAAGLAEGAQPQGAVRGATHPLVPWACRVLVDDTRARGASIFLLASRICHGCGASSGSLSARARACDGSADGRTGGQVAPGAAARMAVLQGRPPAAACIKGRAAAGPRARWGQLEGACNPCCCARCAVRAASRRRS